MRKFARAGWYRERLNWIVVALACTFLLGGTIANNLANRNQAHKTDELARSTHSAICALRSDLVRRVQLNEAILKRHPDGVGGFSTSDLQRSILGQKATIRALATADC